MANRAILLTCSKTRHRERLRARTKPQDVAFKPEETFYIKKKKILLSQGQWIIQSFHKCLHIKDTFTETILALIENKVIDLRTKFQEFKPYLYLMC